MKNVDDLVESAATLAAEGRSKGEIADELNVSRETARWLVDHTATDGTRATSEGTGGPEDVHVDWSAIGRDSTRLHHVGVALADLLSKQGTDVDLTIGVEKAGGPLATTVARELDTDLGTYTPAKHQWGDGNGTGPAADRPTDAGGTFSRNFAAIRGRECYVVDDTITSGTTMRETIAAVRDAGGEPVACGALVDKRGVDALADVPIYSLIGVVRVEGEP
jgi:orotate phosphoribosyltransferase